MSEHYPRIRIDTLFGQRRLLKIRESVSITFYMKRSHQEVVHPVMRALDVYRRAVGPRALGWYAEPYSEDWNELDDKGWASIQRHAGLAFHFPETVLGVTRPLRDLSLRYPGLDIPGARSATSTIGTKVDGVHWLNFLGPPVLGELGGTAGLRARLHSAGTTVQELSGERAVVTLGTWPEAGDTEKGHTLPAWRELARVLEPWLYMDRAHWSGFSEEDMHRWQRRFLGA
jgi:hypothetical protein